MRMGLFYSPRSKLRHLSQSGSGGPKEANQYSEAERYETKHGVDL
jgi:hypothetical protein